MNKLYSFNNNECKTFKFTYNQYYVLEKEYNRYSNYINLVSQSILLLQIKDDKRKQYENKNIIDRFIVECINQGVTPNIDKNMNMNNTFIENTNANTNANTNININLEEENSINTTIIDEYLSNYLFLNKIFENKDLLFKTNYYKKMISEYNEKHIKLTPEKISNINKLLFDSNNYFVKQNKDLYNKIIKYKEKNSSNNNYDASNIFDNIQCSITLQNNEYFIIKYRNYEKTINVKRYYKLIKNYDKPFPYDIIRMILRYGIFDMSNQQWSIGDNLYDDISEIFNISFEMFASPLNFNMNTFCSLFFDTDKIFGSFGSFYNINIDKFLIQNIKGVFFNPPYLPLLMNNSINKCLNILDEMNKLSIDFSIVSFLPNWDDADYIKRFIGSKYTVDSKIVKKGNYVLHEKDKGKLINGTFDLLVIVLNSMKVSWNNEKKSEISKGIDKIVEIMKTESREAFIKKK